MTSESHIDVTIKIPDETVKDLEALTHLTRQPVDSLIENILQGWAEDRVQGKALDELINRDSGHM